MSKSRVLGFLGSLTLVGTLFIVLPGFGADEKEGKDGLYRPLGLFTEVLSLVRSNYVEPVEVKPLLNGAFSGMTEAMDPYSEYIPPDRMAAFLAAQTAREKKEVLDAGVVLAKRFGYPMVVSAVAGSPAAAAGLKTDDVIEKIDDQPVRNIGLWDVEARLAGRPGARVRVVVVREGKPRHRTLEIVRGSWTPATPSAARVEGQMVVRIPDFSVGTAAAVKTLLQPFDRTKPLVVDVRGNASGSFDEAARTAALFVPAGPLGEMKGRKIPLKTFQAEAGERVHESRLVVLVDSGTGGPAELFASAIRDSGMKKAPEKAEKAAEKAKDPAADDDVDDTAPKNGEKPKPVNRLVGEPTSGMGFVSQVVKLTSGGSLRLSVGKLRTVSGRSLSPKGLEPDDRVYPAPPDEGGPPDGDPILDRGLKVLAEPAAEKTAA